MRRLACAVAAALPCALLGGVLALRASGRAGVARRRSGAQALQAKWDAAGADGQAQAQAGAQAAASAAPEPLTCGKYGCIEVRNMAACGCSPFCEEDGDCCPDYAAVCTPAGIQQRLGVWSGCPPGAAPAMPQVPQYSPVGEPLRVRVLSYNPEWWHVIEQLGGNGNSAAQLISTAGRAQPFDIIGFQEFYDPWWGMTRPGYDASELLRDYIYVRGETGGPVGTIIGFRNESWSLLSKGQHFVAEDQQGPVYFGKRIVLWARLWHRQSGHTVFFMNHHGPLSVNSGGVCGGDVTAHNLVQAAVDNAAPGDAIILVGDFNADDSSRTVAQLDSVLHHTFSGIDHIFTNLGEANVACRGALGNGGSDHDAINVVLDLPGASGQAPSGAADCSAGR